MNKKDKNSLLTLTIAVNILISLVKVIKHFRIKKLNKGSEVFKRGSLELETENVAVNHLVKCLNQEAIERVNADEREGFDI